jgi:hypothetical protein
MCAKGAVSVSLHTWLITVRSKPSWAPDSWNGEREQKRGGEEEATLHLHNLRMRGMGVSYERWPDKEGLRRGVERCERERRAVCTPVFLSVSSMFLRNEAHGCSSSPILLTHSNRHTRKYSHAAQGLTGYRTFYIAFGFLFNWKLEFTHATCTYTPLDNNHVETDICLQVGCCWISE